MNNKVERVRIAVIGCGAVAEIGHLPALMANPDCKVVALIDKNLERVEDLARRYKTEIIGDDYSICFGKIDAAVLALPHHLHAPISIDLLRHGIHILVDKPMALSSSECNQMIEAANNAKRVLAIGLTRRFLYSARLTKILIDVGTLGKLESFDFAEGNVYNWPVSSDFFFKKKTAGGGVLFDAGAHILDLLLWWLGEVDSYEYLDDAEGGVEADCLVKLKMKSGVEGTVDLSRTRNLRNTALIRGEFADLKVDLRKNWLAIYPKDGPIICKGNFSPFPNVPNLRGHKAIHAGSKIALSKDALIGHYSIECIAEEGKNCGHSFGTKDKDIVLPVEPYNEYTVHVYLKGIKGDFENVPLFLRVGNQDFSLIKNSIIFLTNDWKRYSLTFTTGENDSSISISVWKKDHEAPIRWLTDAFQIEKGVGSGYYGDKREPTILNSLGEYGSQSFTSLFHTIS